MPAEPGAPPLLETKGLTKRFGAFTANSRIDLAIQPGEVHALLGENGAGKSTLVKMLYGLLQPDEGAILWEGSDVATPEPRIARGRGIGMVFQHFSLFEAMTVGENVALGLDDAPNDARKLHKRIEEVSAAYGLPLNPTQNVYDLSVGERQRIEIVRCLLQSPRLLIMDEPTSVLTPQEVERLFITLRQLAGEGCAILYISHKLEEIRQLCDRATILRGGKVVAACDPKQETARSMANLMVGSEFRTAERRAEKAVAGPVRLSVSGLSMGSEAAHGVGLKNVGFEVRGGEILGIAGVAGNGQGELLAALAGERLADKAEAIVIDGKPVGQSGPSPRRAAGLCAVPEERNGHAAVPELSLTENVLLTGRVRLGLVEKGFLKAPGALDFANKVIAAFDVRCRGPESPAGSLSGGNLQKFIVGREILQQPGVLVVAQPTWGIDAAAVAIVQQALIDLAEKGSAVVVISQDLDELLSLSDRIAVIHVGELSEARPTASLSVEEIGLLMGGAGHKEAAE